MSATFGEFIDIVKKAVEGNSEMSLLFEEWKSAATEEEWARHRAHELLKGHVVAVAQDMANVFRVIIRYIDTDELYTAKVCAGHDFLALVHKAAVELKVDIDLSEVDMPLTEFEQKVMVRIGSCPRPENN